ncbi:heavy-metal-associated domain-containing protein [Streptomyces sp. NPDC059255]|uniref:heavy-metal-associated domain-containing protein n=1 Tax=Streptomyces sp. NPDC059255 TaxID=3346793 RepID=UPI0036B04A9F
MSSSCCTPEGSCHTGSAAKTPAATAVPESRTVVHQVNGVGSAHCQGVVTQAIAGVDGVLSVETEIGTGLVTVTTGGVVEDDRIAKALDEAGYEYAGRV